MQVIKANKNNLSGVLELISTCRDHLLSAGIDQWDDLYPNHNAVLHDLTEENLYIATFADRLVGTIALNRDQEPEYSQISWLYPEPSLVIHRLCVSPAHQGCGVGSALMRFAEQHARNSRLNSLRLDVYSGNPQAVNLYNHLGYKIVGQIMFPRRNRPFYCMEKHISHIADNA